jgi:hypothetical protein
MARAQVLRLAVVAVVAAVGVVDPLSQNPRRPSVGRIPPLVLWWSRDGRRTRSRAASERGNEQENRLLGVLHSRTRVSTLEMASGLSYRERDYGSGECMVQPSMVNTVHSS